MGEGGGGGGGLLAGIPGLGFVISRLIFSVSRYFSLLNFIIPTASLAEITFVHSDRLGDKDVSRQEERWCRSSLFLLLDGD